MTLIIIFRDTKDDNQSDDDKPSTGSGSGSPQLTVTACCLCGQIITVTINMSNQIQEPFFEFSTVVTGPRRELIHFLELAASQDKHFRS